MCCRCVVREHRGRTVREPAEQNVVVVVVQRRGTTVSLSVQALQQPHSTSAQLVGSGERRLDVQSDADSPPGQRLARHSASCIVVNTRLREPQIMRSEIAH